MGLDVTGRSRLRSAGLEALGVGAEHGDGVMDGGADVTDEQHQAWQYTLHEDGGVGTIALARTRGEVGLVGCGRAHQGSDVVGQDLGGHVDDECLLRESRDGFELHAQFQALEERGDILPVNISRVRS